MSDTGRNIKVVADRDIPFLKGALEAVADVVYLPGKEIDSLVLRDADALITRTRTKCNRALLEGSSVKFIATASIGFDHIDTEYSESNETRVGRAIRWLDRSKAWCSCAGS